MSGLELCALGCARGGRWLFRGLQARLPAGSWLRVRGANGAGKTSLLRIVCGLARPSAGTVRWDGHDVHAAGGRAAVPVAHIGHSAALKDDLSAAENLSSRASLAGRPLALGAARQLLGAAGLARCADLPARHLSQGQRRRVALTSLMAAQDAALWVLDEPYDALDDTASAWLSALLATHLRRGGSLLLTSHLAVTLPDAPQALELAL